MADTETPRVSTDRIVAATLSEVQPDKLRRLETWLLNASPMQDAPNVALLIDVVPISVGPSPSPFTAGETLRGEVAFYPSARPLRGQLATRKTANSNIAWPVLPQGLPFALCAYESALARQPWLEWWPLAASRLTVERIAPQQFVLAGDDGLVLPIERSQTDELVFPLGATSR